MTPPEAASFRNKQAPPELTQKPGAAQCGLPGPPAASVGAGGVDKLLCKPSHPFGSTRQNGLFAAISQRARTSRPPRRRHTVSPSAATPSACRQTQGTDGFGPLHPGNRSPCGDCVWAGGSPPLVAMAAPAHMPAGAAANASIAHAAAARRARRLTESGLSTIDISPPCARSQAVASRRDAITKQHR